MNNKIENLIDSTVEPIKEIQNRLLIVENNQNRQFEIISDKLDLLCQTRNNLDLKPPRPLEQQGKSPSSQPPIMSETFKGKARVVESPLHPNISPKRSTSFQPATSNECFKNFALPVTPKPTFSTDTTKIINQSLSRLETWPTFSGEGEYNHIDFIKTIDALQEDTHCEDGVIVNRLRDIMTGVAKQWFESVRNAVGHQSWPFWKSLIYQKYGTTNWRRHMMRQFEKDKFVPGEVPAAVWVTTQYKRIIACEPDTSEEMVIFKLLSLMDGEVCFAAQNSIGEKIELTSLINALDDIREYTNLGRQETSNASEFDSSCGNDTPNAEKSTTSQPKENSDVKCYTCNQSGHTSRHCPKNSRNVSNINKQEESESDEENQHHSESAIFSIIPNDHVSPVTGGNRLVEMTVAQKPCKVLLDSGAWKSVVGKHYLSKFNPDWEKFLFDKNQDQLHIIDNSVVNHFIMGNDYLSYFKISIMNDFGTYT
ncbi:hypothetical protein PSTG_09170 [Puccinia striiformis f. sp. tritici PST-78]|uniref:CCHC-type domain-containing protein n=1 Tax=Puccinia striiformis f. sp. tritici PST-78 TaxID=1165861 RepID=A0A0L0VEK1_9BASI|nr:hypothetical protein PSTG_09170 [Puccinia striiformis f. sp. tritici PST-78]